MVSNLAMVVALAGAQPLCAPDDAACLASADITAAQALPATEQTVPTATGEPPQGGQELPPVTGEILVTGTLEKPVGDPVEEINAATFEVVQKIDTALVEPIAEAYDEGVPKPLRKGLRNALRNLGEPINFLNFMLQLKPRKALKSAARFAINSTIGIAGLWNPASKEPFKLKREPNGFANTLGYYGVGPGPYLYLPFIGSTTVRDLAGRIVDLSIIPNVAGKPFNQPIYAIPVGTLTSLESRIETDDQIEAIRERCGDQYSASRDIYLIQRQIEIDTLRGKQSPKLPELIERLQINCDITLLKSGAIATDEDLPPEAMLPGQGGALAQPENTNSSQTIETPAPSAEALAEPPLPAAPQFVSIPVVQSGFATAEELQATAP